MFDNITKFDTELFLNKHFKILQKIKQFQIRKIRKSFNVVCKVCKILSQYQYKINRYKSIR